MKLRESVHVSQPLGKHEELIWTEFLKSAKYLCSY